MPLTILDHDEIELCIRIGTAAAEFCLDESLDGVPTECPLTIETAASIAEDAGLPQSKLTTAALAVLGQARLRWAQILGGSN